MVGRTVAMPSARGANLRLRRPSEPSAGAGFGCAEGVGWSSRLRLRLAADGTLGATAGRLEEVAVPVVADDMAVPGAAEAAGAGAESGAPGRAGARAGRRDPRELESLATPPDADALPASAEAAAVPAEEAVAVAAACADFACSWTWCS